MHKASNFTGGCLEIRLFYVQISPFPVQALPDHLTLRHLRRETSVSLEINNSIIPSSDSSTISLRRDHINKDTSEVTYVSTDCVRVSGAVEFEVYEKEDEVILSGSLERVDATWTNGNSHTKTGWSMDCYIANGGSEFLHSSVEVYIAGCYSGSPVILTKMIQTSPRSKVMIGKENPEMNELVQITDSDMNDYDSNGKLGQNLNSDEMYLEENGELSWFNAGVRVGVGISLGMCLGVGIGVGILIRSYQATTSRFKKRFF